MRQTKQELLARAKEYGIKGRHDMSKEQLWAAVSAAEVPADTGSDELSGLDGDVLPPERELVTREQHDADMAFVDMDGNEPLADAEAALDTDAEAAAELAPTLDPAVTLDRKRRYPSEARRDSVTRKVVRKGVRFNSNVPFREKLYYLPARLADLEAYHAVVAAAPPQVRAVAATMLADFSTPEDAARGTDIVARAKATGRLVSKIDDAMLFAYYRRVLETVGVVHHEGD